MKIEDVLTYKGKEYVTIKEFARRVDVSRQAVEGMIKKGSLSAQTIAGYKLIYIDWEANSAIYRRNRSVKAQNRKKVHVAVNDDGAGKTTIKRISDIMEPDVHSVGVSQPRIADETIPEEVIDLTAFDKTIYADCLDPMGNFDYDLLKTRLTAETYKMKLDKEKGTLVEKTAVVESAKAIAQIIQSNLDAIPVRYTSSLIANAVSILARKGVPCSFTEEERTEMRVTLKNVAKEIMFSIQKEINALTGEDED